MSNITATIGDTSVLDVKIYKDEELLDLSDYLVLFTVKKPFTGFTATHDNSDLEAVITKNSDPDSIGGIQKYGLGNVKIIIGSGDTRSIVDGDYYYDIQISQSTSTQDVVITVISGTITFEKQITSRLQALS